MGARAGPRHPPAPAPTTWAFVGSAAAGLAAAAGSSSCYADLATAGAAEMTVLLAPDMPGTWAERRAGIEQLVEELTAGAARAGSGQLVLVTRRAVAVSARDDPADPAQAMLAAAAGQVLGSRAILVDRTAHRRSTPCRTRPA
ncbi:hypothetical protein Srubr_18780 [Streptomyces rubradiris]|uniref:Uncharacterized protein n=1 Tax=Streptomyces rubradiris TaxID=285531 RepID=A0ABQ3R863_STRRR|nr:hypothetical protein [Streptomyces rubradiris]GHI52032.1 hypothetical protein Srubr_18780 [Streptomyces rubradiris]